MAKAALKTAAPVTDIEPTPSAPGGKTVLQIDKSGARVIEMAPASPFVVGGVKVAKIIISPISFADYVRAFDNASPAAVSFAGDRLSRCTIICGGPIYQRALACLNLTIYAI